MLELTNTITSYLRTATLLAVLVLPIPYTYPDNMEFLLYPNSNPE